MNPRCARSLVPVICGALLVACSTLMPPPAAPKFPASAAVIEEMQATRPAFAALRPQDQATVYLWLNANCAVDGEDRRAAILAMPRDAEIVLIEAFRMRPPSALLDELAETRREEFDGIQRELASDDIAWVDAGTRQRLTTLSQSSFVAAGIDATIRNYRVAALQGIALVGTTTSISWLERALPDIAGAELKQSAQQTLVELRRRLKSK